MLRVAKAKLSIRQLGLFCFRGGYSLFKIFRKTCVKGKLRFWPEGLKDLTHPGGDGMQISASYPDSGQT